MPSDRRQRPAPPRRLGVRALRDHLGDVLRQAREGTTFLVTSRGQVVAELRPPPRDARAPREPGALKGRIRMAPDFDLLPEDVLAAMEGRSE